MRLGVIGHVEHVTIARAEALPRAGEIVHLGAPEVIAGGGGGIAFFQLVKSPAEVHLFTALGLDDSALEVHDQISKTGAVIHAALRQAAHTRDLVIVTADGERTIFVVGEPLHPRIDDHLSWEVLSSCEGAYFTGQDAGTLRAARGAGVLVVTARRSHVLAEAGVVADVVVGSARDPREASRLGDYAVPPRALVMTEGAYGGRIETADGVVRFEASPGPERVVGMYGAGDTFAGALTWYVSLGLGIEEACVRAAVHAAAVLGGVNPVAGQVALGAG